MISYQWRDKQGFQISPFLSSPLFTMCQHVFLSLSLRAYKLSFPFTISPLVCLSALSHIHIIIRVCLPVSLISSTFCGISLNTLTNHLFFVWNCWAFSVILSTMTPCDVTSLIYWFSADSFSYYESIYGGQPHGERQPFLYAPGVDDNALHAMKTPRDAISKQPKQQPYANLPQPVRSAPISVFASKESEKEYQNSKRPDIRVISLTNFKRNLSLHKTDTRGLWN